MQGDNVFNQAKAHRRQDKIDDRLESYYPIISQSMESYQAENPAGFKLHGRDGHGELVACAQLQQSNESGGLRHIL